MVKEQDFPLLKQADSMEHFITEISRLYGDMLRNSWRKIPLYQPFSLSDDLSLTVLCRGFEKSENKENLNPAFLSAKLQINHEILSGDIVIHRKSSDWILQGCYQDPACKNVVLYVVEWDDVPENQRNLLPDKILIGNLAALTGSEAVQQNDNTDSSKGLCAGFFSGLSGEDLLKFVEEAGLERFAIKVEEMLQNMIEYGRAKAFWQRFFELMGLGANRKVFCDLWNRLLNYPDDILQKKFPILLWGESGLLPDPSSRDLPEDAMQLVKTIWNEWWSLRRSDEQILNFKRAGRPLNSVERRLALLERFYQSFSWDPFEKLLALLDQYQNNPEKIPHYFMDLQDHEDSFWHTHTTFTSPKSSQKKALIGIDRAGMLLTDLIYPAIFAYAKLQNNVPLAEQILVFYRMLPACSNHRTLQIMQNYCFSSHRKIFRSSVSQQGLIHLYQSFCARNSFDCKNCILYQSV